MRAYEFIRNIVCMPNYNVKFLGRSAGIVTGTYGMTHQGTEDMALLRTLPNLLVITPVTPIEAREAVRYAYQHIGPVYIRLEGHSEPELYNDAYQFTVGKGIVVRSGDDMTVFATGSIINEALQAADCLQQKGISVRIIDLPMLRPVDTDLIVQAAKETKYILTLEEHSIYGGLGSTVAEVLAEQQCTVRFSRMGLQSYAVGCGNRDEMRKLNGLAAEDIVRTIDKIMDEG